MKQTAEHEITVRIRTRYPQEDLAALVSNGLNSRSVANKGHVNRRKSVDGMFVKDLAWQWLTGNRMRSNRSGAFCCKK